MYTIKIKILALFISFFSVGFALAQNPDTAGKKPARATGQFEDEADSLRRKHLDPSYRSDTQQRLRPDNMPAVKPDTGTQPIPVAQPATKDRMPVKELSDTLQKK
jgi:hypothetical protein